MTKGARKTRTTVQKNEKEVDKEKVRANGKKVDRDKKSGKDKTKVQFKVIDLMNEDDAVKENG